MPRQLAEEKPCAVMEGKAVATGPYALRFLPRRIVVLWGHWREHDERTAGCSGHPEERGVRDLTARPRRCWLSPCARSGDGAWPG
jgi:hypothetical protein